MQKISIIDKKIECGVWQMEKRFSIRTDLAIESCELGKNNTEIEGVKISTQKFKQIQVTNVEIIDEAGEKNLGKPKGNYITIESAQLRKNNDYKDKIIKILADNISKLIAHVKRDNVLVIGLGNWKITADALGPKVISKILVTRHIKNFLADQLKKSLCSVSAISPGVLGITGLETFEVVKGICDKTNPDIIFVIDSLAARNSSRINSTIQISNTGIIPGAGIGNKRIALDKKNLGCDVISIGVPTVIDAATLINDTMDKILEAISYHQKLQNNFFIALNDIDSNEKYELIKNILEPYNENMFVTPKEVDQVIEELSNIIANAINISLHNSLDMDDINKYIYG